jgi:hypothetical protein
VSAFSSAGKIALSAVHFQLDLSYADGKRERRDLVLVYDPQNSYYLWHISEGTAPAYSERFLECLKLYRYWTDADGLYEFTSRMNLYVKVGTLKADNRGAAQRAAIAEIAQRLPEVAKYGYAPTPGGTRWPWDYRQITLPTSLDFACGLPLRANCSPGPDEILSIDKRDSEWRILRKNHWVEEIILDQHFDPIGRNQRTDGQTEKRSCG